MNKMKILLGILCISLIVPIFQHINVQATKDRTLEQMIIDEFVIVNEDGSTRIVQAETISATEKEISVADKYEIINNVGGDIVETYATEQEAIEAASLMEEEDLTVQAFDLRTVEYGVVYIKTSTFSEFKMVETGQTGYTHGAFGRDAAYIGTFNGKIRAKIAGVVGDFDPSDVDVVSYEGNPTSYYINEEGYLYHYYLYDTDKVYAKTRVGYALDYLQVDTKYYSYDGHYFYETYPQMIQDYQNDTYANSVNSNNPYYNYYQFLSHRTKTTYTADDFNEISIKRLGETSYLTSKFNNIGNAFIENQDTYYINALLMFGVAANESNWGKSSIALDKNNLFGHGAVDNNPYYGADGYESPAESIMYHAYRFLSYGYLDYEDYRYFGPHTGDKESGINVKYASDPYWGEKAACRAYYLDEVPADYQTETIGIIEGTLSGVKLYNEPSTDATAVAKLNNLTNIPVLILDTVNVNGKQWYKIASDTSLNDTRTESNYKLVYRPEQDYLYIQADKVLIVNQSKNITDGTITIPSLESGHKIEIQSGNLVTESKTTVADIKAIDASAIVKNGDQEITDTNAAIGTGYTVTISDKTYTLIKLGDANGDGAINSGDLFAIQKHLITGAEVSDAIFKGMDANKDGIINSGDLFTVQKHLIGKGNITL